MIEKLIPLGCFILGMIVSYLITFRCMKAVMVLAYKIRENMPYEKYEEIEQTETE
jgi:hypothetical protein